MHHSDQQIPFAQRRLIRAGACNFPGHAGQRGGKVVFLLRRARQLNAQRPLRLRFPQHLEDAATKHFLRNADTDLGRRRGLPPFLDV